MSAELFRALRAARTIESQIEQLKRTPLPTEARAAEVGLATVTRYFESEEDRRRSIEDKAKTNVAGTAIAVTLLTGGSSLLWGEQSSTWTSSLVQWLSRGLLAGAASYFLGGAWFALRALKVGPVHQFTLDELDLTDETEKTKHLWRYVELNELETRVRTNSLSVSFDCIRNGVVCLAILVVLVSMALSASDQSELPHAITAGSEARVLLAGEGHLAVSGGTASPFPATAGFLRECSVRAVGRALDLLGEVEAVSSGPCAESHRSRK